MRTVFWATGPDGGQQSIAGMPLRDGQPVVGDRMRLRMEDGWLIFQVIGREWVVEQNENGGGVTVHLSVQITQIGAVPDELAVASDDSDDALRGTDGGPDDRSAVPGG
jgi:hypothetical protein